MGFIQKHMRGRKKKGFTLIELLVVIAVIGILFVVLQSKVDFATDKAKETGVKTDFRSYQLAMETVAREQSGFDGLSGAEIIAELNKNLDAKLQIEDDGTIGAKDPWGQAYVLVGAEDGTDVADFDAASAGDINQVVIVSYGPDKATGGDDDYSIQTMYTTGTAVDGVDATGLFTTDDKGVTSHTTGFSNNL